MKCFLAAVLLTLCAATANAAYIYKVDHTFGDYTLTGTIETDINNGVITDIPLNSFSLTMTYGGNPIIIENVFVSGEAVIATPEELQYVFNDPSDPDNTSSLLFSNSNAPSHLWCLQTITGCSSPGTYEAIIISGSTILQEPRSGVVTLATIVPVPAAVWLFGSGLIGLVGFARRKR